MICTVIQHKNLEEIEEILEHCEMAEIRLDRCPLTLEEISECFTSDVPLIATCRLAEVMENEPSLQNLPEENRLVKAGQFIEKRLTAAIEAGARYVDVELEVPKHISKRIRQVAHENGTTFIRSFHDFSGTDSKEALLAVAEKCRYHGADLVKIATTAQSEADCERVMSLYEATAKEEVLQSGNLVAFCMGEAGVQTRTDALKLGAPFTYSALAADNVAAPGQQTAAEMTASVYKDFPFLDTVQQVPSSKSFAQRAIVAAALAGGVSHLSGYTPCGDNEAALDFVRSLGAKVEVTGAEGEQGLVIEGIGAELGKLQLERANVGESGLLARLAMPLLCQLNEGEVIVEGEKTLLKRPMAGVRDMLAAFGVEVRSAAAPVAGGATSAGGASSVSDGAASVGGAAGEAALTVPLALKGQLKNGRVDISGKNGSQLVSGLLMALPLAQKNTTFGVKDPKSIPDMFITLDVLRKFGIRVANDMLGGHDFLESGGDWSLCNEMVFKVKGGQRYHAADFAIEGDWSAAANYLVAGAVFGKAVVRGLDTTSLQADLSIMDVLMDAGASLSQLDGDKGDILVQRAPLQAFEVDLTHCPDLFPIVAVLAVFCQGKSRLGGLSRLAHKECNRADAIVEMLQKMGVQVDVQEDVLQILGETLAQRILNGHLLQGGEYSSRHDHRMAMALKVASLCASSPVLVDDMDCVAKSNPLFKSFLA